MGYGTSSIYPTSAPGADFHNWDAVSRRRYGAASGAPRASWDVPPDWQPQQHESAAPQPANSGWSQGGSPGAPSGGNTVSGSWGSSGDSYLDTLRSLGFSDALGQMGAARHAALNASPNDPALAAFADLNSLTAGQGNEARALNQTGAGVMGQLRQRDIEEQLAKYQADLQKQMYEEMNQGSWMGDLGQVLGGIGGAWLSPGGLFKGVGGIAKAAG